MRRALPAIWSVALALLLLGPALKPGFVLSYDMVWVPDLALRPDFFGAGSGLPRAVPSDAAVALLDQLVGGMLLQKLVLVGCLVGGGLGALRLAPSNSLAGRLVAVTLYQWNPFVAERLLIGHWPVLIGYATLPWLVDATGRWRRDGTLPTSLWILLPLGSLSAGAGLVTGVALLAFAGARDVRRLVGLAALLVAANAPWLVAGFLHASAATTDPAGARAFALHGEGSLPAPLAAVGLGGIWNAEVVPGSRTGVLGWLSLLLLVALVLAGATTWWTHVVRREAWAFIACWLIGWGLAVTTWLVPGSMAWLFAHVPGSGVVRDGARILALCAPLTVAVASRGAARIVGSLPSANRMPIAVALVLLPVALLPDVAFGLAGKLRATSYPADYARARAAVVEHSDATGERGDVLVLPLSSYRQPSWNGDRKVLDPTGRYLTPDYLASYRLIVSGRSLAGEDPRVGQAARALDEPTAGARARALGRLGIGYVAVDASRPRPEPVAGRVIARGAQLTVVALEVPVRRTSVPSGWRISLVVAWSLFVALPLVSVLTSTLRGVRRRRRRSVTGR